MVEHTDEDNPNLIQINKIDLKSLLKLKTK